MKKMLALATLVFAMMAATPVFLADEPHVFVVTDGKSVLMADSTGRIVVPPGKYPQINPVIGSSDLFFVEDPDPNAPIIGQWDYVGMHPFALMNAKGELLTDFIYDPFPFRLVSTGRILFYKNGFKKGIMDTEGREIVPAIYDWIDPDGRDGFIAIRIISNGRDGASRDIYAISPDGGTRRLSQEAKGYFDILEGAYIAHMGDNGKYGVMDMQGNWVISSIYDEISNMLSNTLFLATHGNERVIVSSKTLRPVENVNVEVEDDVSLYGTYIAINRGNELLVFTETGELYSRCTIDINERPSAFWPSDGESAPSLIYTYDPNDVVYDLTGKKIGEDMYGLTWAGKWKDADLYAYFVDDPTGKPSDVNIYIDSTKAFYFFDDAPSAYGTAKSGVMNSKGEVLIKPERFDYLYPLGEGCFYAWEGNTCGAIDIEGNWIVKISE